MPSINLAGKIKSVSCRNFVTYEECVFRPNEYLNVIIGPNGTGKSTLVAAIVIGFGGDPKLLNRSTSILDYIKNGKTAASIAIEIYQSNNKASFALLQRSFSSAGKSEFKVNGESMTKAKYLVAVANFKIQIGNLCQFLPQDRVHDFAKMNPQELFANTIKSVCDQNEIKMFEDLKSLRSQQSSSKSTLIQNTQKLRQITARLDELKVVLGRYSQRKDYADKLNICLGKQAWLEVDEIEKKFQAQSVDKVQAEKLLQKVEREFTTVKRKQDAIAQTKNKLRSDAEKKRAIATRLFEEDNNVTKEIEELILKIKASKRAFENSKRELASARQDIARETVILEAIAQDLKNMNDHHGSIKNIKAQLQPLNEQILQFRDEISKRLEKIATINNRLDDEYVSQIQMLKRRIERAHNIKNSKLELLRTNFHNVYEAVQWLEKNQDRFEGKVYSPILLELNVKMPNYDKYAENTIPLRDLLAFTCERKSDMSLLIDELCVKQRLGVNVIFSEPAETCNYQSDIPIQNLSHYGFETYLIDTLEGPPSIMNYLCTSYRIHQIPIGGERVSECTDEIPSNIRLYFGANYRYQCSISKYSGEASLMQNQIDGKHLLKCVDVKQVEAMKRELNKLLQESDALKNRCTKIQSEIKDIEVQCEEVRSEKRSVEGKFMQIKEMLSRFERQKDKLIRLKGNMIDLPEAERKFFAETSRTINSLVQLQKKRIKSLNACQSAIAEKQFADVKITVYCQQSENLETQLRDVSERKQSSRQTYESIERAMAVSKRKMEEKISQAKAATNGCSPNDRNFPYKNEFRELPNSLAELREHINEFKARLECMTDVDESSIKEYEDKTAELELLKNSIDEIHVQESDLETKIKTIFNDWYSKIERIVQILNTQFSGFMSSMSFVGEINLSKKEDYDFDSYGIQIMVQYRKEVPLQALDRCRQSGGERAVAIAVYSLSMQHITHVPFRCVDEINQGMDSRNERKIFEMLVQETTKNGRSQYFFVTPKLLPGLAHHKRMMVHIVFNGKFVKSGGLD